MNQICKACNVEKDMHSEFYKRDATCKKCRKAQQAARLENRKTYVAPNNPHENAFIEACKAQGIHAQPTADFRNYKYSDVIAWGCVRIEVKYPQIYGDNDTHKWVFSQKQARERIPVDLIVLISEFNGVTSYHIFDPLHPTFFSKNKRRRYALTYTHESGMNREERNALYGVTSLSETIMRTHQDNWYMIETVRLDKSRILKRQAQPAIVITEGNAA
jgi:hypothetical protein